MLECNLETPVCRLYKYEVAILAAMKKTVRDESLTVLSFSSNLVFVIVDMVDAVAVVAVAAGTVAKFHVGVVCIGDAADCAFVQVALALLYLLLGPLEVDGLGICLALDLLVFAGEDFFQIVPEEDQVVQNSDDNGQCADKISRDQCVYKGNEDHRRRNQRKPFCFDDDDEICADIVVRRDGCVSKEQRQIQIVSCSCSEGGGPYGVGDKAGDDCKDQPQQIVHEKAGGTPVLFQKAAQIQVKQDRENEEERTEYGNKDK